MGGAQNNPLQNGGGGSGGDGGGIPFRTVGGVEERNTPRPSHIAGRMKASTGSLGPYVGAQDSIPALSV